MDEKSLKLRCVIKSQYKSIRTFADAVGIPNTTLVTALNNGIGGMAVEKVIQICDKLGIDVKTFEPCDSVSDLNFEEKDIIKKYRLLDEGGKGRIKNQLNFEVDQQAKEAENKEEHLA